MSSQHKNPGHNLPEQIPWHDALSTMLAPYQPVASEKDADKFFTTAEIKAALEAHYAIPQGDPEAQGINGLELVEILHELGFRAASTGELGLQWLMKKK